MARVQVRLTFPIGLLLVILMAASVRANAVTLPFFEDFDTPTDDAVATYSHFTADQGGAGFDTTRIVNANGVLRTGNGGFPYYPAFSVTPNPFPTGEIIIKADMGWNGTEIDPPVAPGFGGAGLRLGQRIGPNGVEAENVLAFHPGYSPPQGAFRVEGPGGIGNTDMGWVPAVGVLHHVEIHSFPDGFFDIKVTDGLNPANVFTTSFSNPAAYGGDIGFLAFAGGSAMYDNLYISIAGQSILGDYNNDGFVDAADYVIWRKGGPLLNESETVGSNTPEDYDFWRSQFGLPSSGPSSASAVPEASSLLISLIGAASISAFLRCRPIVACR